MRQKGESQNGCYKETKHAKFSEKKTNIFYPFPVRFRRSEMFAFQKIWCALFSCNICFEIRSFILLPTIQPSKL